MKFYRVFLWMVLVLAPAAWSATPGSLTLCLEAAGSLASSPISLTADQGLGGVGSLEYRFSDLFAAGFTAGLVEYIAAPAHPDPINLQDMKTLWLDLSGWLYPLPVSPLGEAYVQAGFGVSPHLGLFPDYFPNYSQQVFGEKYYAVPPGTIFWDVQASLGYRFTLDKGWALDTGFQWDHFWPPEDRPLDTFALRLGFAWSFGL